MATERVLLGNDFKVLIGDENSPPNFTDMCAVVDFGSVGEEKPLVDITTLCDDARAYRNGLADGVEIPLQMNYISGDTAAIALYDAYNNDTLVPIRIQKKAQPDDSPSEEEEYFEFNATVRAWNVQGAIGERAALTFTLKVSGAVSWVTPTVES